MLVEKVTDSVSWFFMITLAKIMTFSLLFSIHVLFQDFYVLKNEKSNFVTSELFRTSGNPEAGSFFTFINKGVHSPLPVNHHIHLYVSIYMYI